jgi:hypothetical protein
MNPRRLAVIASTLIGAALLAGCAGLKNVTSEVSSFGDWPADRTPGSYTIERLPSQQASNPAQQEQIEQGAHDALRAAGFTPAAEGEPSDVVVQVGARITRYDRSPWDDPFWWPGYYGPRWGGYGGYGGWYGHPRYYGYYRGYYPYGGWGWGSYGPDYEREVGLLIRDRASGRPLYEARARNDGISAGGQPMLIAMFAAAMKDFPKTQNEPHDVQTVMP